MGGGFVGLAAVCALKKAHAQVGLIDKTNHHVFQPLLYPVATGILSPEHIAAPLRQVLGKQLDTIVLKETVIAVDAQKKLCVVEGARRVRREPAGFRPSGKRRRDWWRQCQKPEETAAPLPDRRRCLCFPWRISHVGNRRNQGQPWVDKKVIPATLS